jgi:hypothetical protein
MMQVIKVDKLIVCIDLLFNKYFYIWNRTERISQTQISDPKWLLIEV